MNFSKVYNRHIEPIIHLLSNNLESYIKDTGIDYSARAMEKPSDHCPIWLELK